jgi:chromosome segregation ATPase
MSTHSSDQQDNDDTDELPVLLEEMAFDPDTQRSLGAPRTEDTSEQTAIEAAAAHDDAPQTHAELAERAARIASLEAEVRAHRDQGRELERHLAEKDERMRELNRTLDALRQSIDGTAGSERRLGALVADRDARVTELTATVERLRADAGARSGELERLRATHETALREIDALKRKLAATAAAPPVAAEEKLREDNAALTAYIAGRRTWWDETQATQTQLAARVEALEHELATRTRRLASVEALAAQETDRARTLRNELTGAARRTAELERELRDARAASPPAPLPPVDNAAFASASAPSAEALATSDKSAAAEDSTLAAQAAPSQVAPPSATAVATEAVAQLEAEVEYKRQQVAAQLVELRDRDQRLRAVTGDLERLRRELAAARTDLDESRASVARLEKAIVEKDRALDARDGRISALHDELKQHLGIIEKLNAIDFSLPKLEPGASKVEAPPESTSAPTLICLTGDAPKRFPLTKRTVTLGRGPQCDLQVVTHFVSREHARITLTDGKPLIEDLGSRNGVFVNSVRVDRRTLLHGDLVTIGESQFRFVESTAH